MEKHWLHPKKTQSLQWSSMLYEQDCVIQIRLPYRLFGLTRTAVHKYHWQQIEQIEVIILIKMVNGKGWQEEGAKKVWDDFRASLNSKK